MNKYIIFLLLIFISIGFAYLSTQLNINGGANVRGNTWDIHFENVNVIKSLDGNPLPTISSDGKTVDYVANLDEPGDSFVFTVDVVNEGSLDAMIEEINEPGLTEEQKKIIDVSYQYANGDPFEDKFVLLKNETKTIKVTVTFKYDIEEEDLPDENLSLDLDFNISYQQANEEAIYDLTINVTPKESYSNLTLDDVATFIVTITNDGISPINNITLAVDLTAEDWIIESLEPGESISRETSYTIDENAILDGKLDVIAVATRIENGKNVVSKGNYVFTGIEPKDDTLSVNISTINPKSTYNLGESVDQRVVVTNEGNVTISNIKVKLQAPTGSASTSPTGWLTSGRSKVYNKPYIIGDNSNLINNLNNHSNFEIWDEFEIVSLSPGDSEIHDTVYNVREYDILAGKIDLTADAKGIAGGENVSAEANNEFGDIEEKVSSMSIDLVTTSSPSNGVGYELGEEIDYKITVTNDGNMTINNITLTDDLTGDEWTIESLTPGESKVFTATFTVREEEILAGNIINVADVVGTSFDPESPEVTASKDVTSPADDPNGSLSVDVVTTNEPTNQEGYELGEEIVYEITVLNAGNLTITGINVVDKLTGDVWTIASLAPKKSQTFKAHHRVTEADILSGEVINIITANGTSPNPDNPEVNASGEDPELIVNPNGLLSVDVITTNVPDNQEGYDLGEDIEYEITVINEGNLTISDINVVDELTGDVWTVVSLAPGKSTLITATYTLIEADILAGNVINDVYVTGTSPDPDNPEVNASGEDSEPTVDPYSHLSVTFEVTNPKSKYVAGDEINISLTLINNGNLTISGIAFDSETTGSAWNNLSLSPTSSLLRTTSYIVTPDDVTAGEMHFIVTATGDSPDPDNPTVSTTKDNVVFIESNTLNSIRSLYRKVIGAFNVKG